MKAHTQTFKENLITLGKEIDAKVTYTIDGVETELDGDTLSSVTPHYEGSILKSVMKQVDIVSDVDIPLNTEINVQFGMKYDDDEYEYVDYGNYIVFSSEKQEDTNNYKIIAYDKMLYAMKDYEQLYNINLFDSEFAKDNASYTIPIETSTYGNLTAYKIELEPNTQYTITLNLNDYTLSNAWIYAIVNSDLSAIKQLQYGGTTSGSATFTTNEDGFVYIGQRYGDTSRLEEYFNKVSISLEKGNQAIGVYPVTINQYIEKLCNKIGLEFANSNEIYCNYDKEITQELYANLGYTYRDVLDELAQVTASTICINKNDELEIRYIKEAIANPRRGD